MLTKQNQHLLSSLNVKEETNQFIKLHEKFVVVGAVYFLKFAGDRFLSVEFMSTENDSSSLVPCFSTQPSQHVLLLDAGENYYYIVVPQTGRIVDSKNGKTDRVAIAQDWQVLTVEYANPENGAGVVLEPFSANDNQKFKFVPAGQGDYYLWAKHSSKVLCAEDEDTCESSRLFQWKLLGENNQKASLIKM